MSIPENKFHATVTDRDRYNLRIYIPEKFRIYNELKKPSIITFDTGSKNPSERLFNIEYHASLGIGDEENLIREIILPKKIAQKIGVMEGDVLEIKKIEEKDKTVFFCSDTTKNEPDSTVKKNLKNKMRNERVLRS